MKETEKVAEACCLYNESEQTLYLIYVSLINKVIDNSSSDMNTTLYFVRCVAPEENRESCVNGFINLCCIMGYFCSRKLLMLSQKKIDDWLCFVVSK